MRTFLFLIVATGSFWGFSQSAFDEAMELYRRGDSIVQSQLPNHYVKAAEYLRKATRLFEELDSTYWQWCSEVDLVVTEVWGDSPSTGLAMARELRKELEQAAAPDSLLAKTLYLQGAALVFLDRGQEAIPIFQRSIALFESVGITGQAYIDALWFLGSQYDKIGQLDVAIECYTTTLAHLQRLRSSRYRSRSLFKLNINLSLNMIDIGNISKALEKLHQCEEHLRGGLEFFSDADWALLYDIYADVYLAALDYDMALRFLDRSIQFEENFNAYNSKANTLRQMGRFQEAIEIHRNNVKWSDDSGISYHNIGFVYLEMNQLDSALKYYLAAEQWKRQNLHRHGASRLAFTLADLGATLTKLGDYRDANEYLQESIRLFPLEKAQMAYKELSINYFHRGMYDSARHFAESSALRFKNGSRLEIDRRLGFGSMSDKLTRFKWLVAFYDAMDNIGSNVPKQTIEVTSQLHHYLLQGPSIKGSHQYLMDQISFVYQEGIRNSLKLAERKDPKWVSQAFTFSEWSKARSLQGAWQGAEARSYGNIPSDLLELENDLLVNENYARSQVQRFGNGAEADSSYLAYYKDKLFRLQHSQDSLRNVFETNYPRYHQLRYASDSISVQDVQRQLADNQAFIEYYVGDTVSYVFTITQDQYEVKQIDLVNDSLTFDLRASFKHEAQLQSPDAYQAMAFPIYERYLKPAVEELDPEIDELIIVPDGNLSYFPLGALVTRQMSNVNSFRDLSYLMDDFTIHYAYSASLHFNECSSLSDNNDLLAFAPSYETTLQDTARMRGFGQFRSQIRALAHTTPEVTAIGEYFDGQTFLGEVASEQNFKAHLDDPGILHLAMHAIVDDEDPMMSRLLFYNDEDTIEDGYLHAFEIYNMRIPSKMTVLSACETGYGKMAKGEGAMSLARAFAYAGSPSIVMSHWQVDDQSTAELMTHFYKHLSNGQSKGAALRMARQDFLETADISRSHPFFWASFVAMGDDRPLKGQAKERWALAAILVALLAGIGWQFYWKRTKAVG